MSSFALAFDLASKFSAERAATKFGWNQLGDLTIDQVWGLGAEEANYRKSREPLCLGPAEDEGETNLIMISEVLYNSVEWFAKGSNQNGAYFSHRDEK
ncbi:hypothetical protein FH972_002596 [Carpinus fangiana]|uniref:Uncharacterized protein n=1 Tax=Carpinus fangiana TaxID=176857 RepID=A0A5N6QFQ1_9ROSI|nr:hypothetical protein FH972_002596 [Carpinus fangiana]